MIVALSFSEAPYFAPCRAKGKIGHVPDHAKQIPHSRFVAVCGRKKTPPDVVSGGVHVLSQHFRKRFWVVTPFYGFFKKFDIDIVGGKYVG